MDQQTAAEETQASGNDTLAKYHLSPYRNDNDEDDDDDVQDIELFVQFITTGKFLPVYKRKVDKKKKKKTCGNDCPIPFHWLRLDTLCCRTLTCSSVLTPCWVWRAERARINFLRGFALPDLIRYLRVPISLATTDLQTAGIMPGLSQSTTLIKSLDLTRTIPLTHTRTRPHLAHPGGQRGEEHGSMKKMKKKKKQDQRTWLIPLSQDNSCSRKKLFWLLFATCCSSALPAFDGLLHDFLTTDTCASASAKRFRHTWAAQVWKVDM